MNFHSLDYFVFLTCALVVYHWLASRTGLRFGFLFLASCAFYMAWNPAYIALILFSITLDYVAGRSIFAAAQTGELRKKRAWLVASLAANLGLLGTFKYFNFFSRALADAAQAVGLPVTAAQLDVVLPVGISFYTFESLSYTIDVYRGRLTPSRNFVRFACFITFFPHLVAGPIVRAADFLPQLEGPRRLAPRAVSDGAFLIATGLVKKVVFADYLAVNLVDRVFDDPTAYSSAEVMVGLYAYTMQIFCDFSGYTDVARGSAMLFGLELPENFDRPYLATSPADFWRRWHMTLSTWLRDYLYFPLGGSQVAPLRAYANLWLTVFLVGLWHGAAWTFVIYGILHATAMVVHRFFVRRFGRASATAEGAYVRALKIFGTLHFVVLSRIFFRAPDVDGARTVMSTLAEGTTTLFHVTASLWLVLLLGYAAHFTPRPWFAALRERFVALPVVAQGVVLAAVAALLMLVATQDVVPYIYFQF